MISRIFVSVLLTTLLVVSAEASPTQFKNIRQAFKSFNDFTEEEGTFKVIETSPLHIQIAPYFYPGEAKDVTEFNVIRGLMYGIYRTFIHTNLETVTVTSLPLVYDLNDKGRYLYKQQNALTVKITRMQALEICKRIIGVSGFDELVTDEKILDESIPDVWSAKFKAYYSANSGGKNLRRLFNEVKKYLI